MARAKYGGEKNLPKIQSILPYLFETLLDGTPNVCSKDFIIEQADNSQTVQSLLPANVNVQESAKAYMLSLDQIFLQ